MAEENGAFDLARIKTEVRKEVVSQAIKALLVAFIALIGLAAMGWWLYLKPKLVEVTGGVPEDAVLAFDLPGGCPKSAGWAPLDEASGKFLLGASSERQYRVAGGKGTYTLTASNIPPLTAVVSATNSARLVNATTFDGGGGVSPLVSDSGKRHPYAESVQLSIGGDRSPAPYDVMPPYLPLYFCKKT